MVGHNQKYPLGCVFRWVLSSLLCVADSYRYGSACRLKPNLFLLRSAVVSCVLRQATYRRAHVQGQIRRQQGCLRRSTFRERDLKGPNDAELPSAGAAAPRRIHSGWQPAMGGSTRAYQGSGVRTRNAPGLALFEACKRLGIEEASVFGFTQDNTHRPHAQAQQFRAACDAFWPDFEPSHLDRALMWLEQQDPTLGG